jgi:hypothetical protein
VKKRKRVSRRIVLFGNWYRPHKQYWEPAPTMMEAMEIVMVEYIRPALIEQVQANSVIWDRFLKLVRPSKIHVG